MGSSLALRCAAALVAAATTVVFSADAGAAGRVMRHAAAGNVKEVRLAQAASSEWSRLWTQYRLSGTGRLAIVTPVPAGTFVDPAPDAWFEALETATSPRVVAPAGTPECGGLGHVHVTGDLSHSTTLPPSQIAVLSSVVDVKQFVLDHAIPFYAADQAALSEHAPPFVAVVYELSGSTVLTQSVRFTTSGAAAPIAFELAYTGTTMPDLTLWTIGPGRARIVGAIEHTPDLLGFEWIAAQGKSDYPERRRKRLLDDFGAAWLVETAGTPPLFQWGMLPDQGGVIPPVVNDYFERAVDQGTAPSPVASCLQGVLDARELGKSSAAVVADPCALGALTTVPTSSGAPPACNDQPGAGEIDAATLACGGAEDLAHAFAGMRVDQARITRQRGVLHSKTQNVTIELYDGTSLPRVLTAPEVDLEDCGMGSGGSWSGSGAYSGSGATSGSGGYSGSAGSGGDGYYEETHTDVHVGCSGSSESGSGDSCSGDSSSSSDDDSCSGDSSSGSDGDSCSGDSSSSEGDSCGGDSSDSGGESCSGDSGGGGESCSGDSGGGESCSGGSSSSGDCSVSEHRPRRIKLSLWMLAAAALAFPLRRFGRRERRGRRRA